MMTTVPPSSPPTRSQRAWIWAATSVLLLFVASRCLQPMDETDLFYNLRLGEIILGDRAVPRTNLLSFTNPDFPDPNLAWLFQIGIALAYRAGGIAATVLLKTAFVVTTFALLFRVALRRGAHPVLTALALALAAWAAEPRFVERPHLVTFVGLGLVLLALDRAEAGPRGLLFALLPIGLLWANGNSCFFLAPVLLALYGLGCRLDGRPTDGTRAVLIALGLLPVLFATPSGAGFLGYVANHFRMPYLRPLQEYRVAEWPTDGPFFFLCGAVVATAGLSAVVPGGARPALRHLLPIVALGLLGARRIRFVAEFSLLAGPYVAAQATGLLDRRPRGDRLGDWTPSAKTWWAGQIGILSGLLVLACAPRIEAARRGQRLVDLEIEPGLVPFAAIDWIDGHGLRDRLYNDLEVGSYLAWEGWPRHRVFQDPRINGYPAAWHALLRRTDLDSEEWSEFLARYGVRAALVSFPEVNPRAALFNPARWALVLRSADALVFARRELDTEALVAAEEIPLTFAFDPANGTQPLPIESAPPASPVSQCEWQRRLAEVYVERRAWDRADAALRRALAPPMTCLAPARRIDALMQAAAVALDRGDIGRAAALLEGMTGPTARTNRGFALVRLGRAAEALEEFRAAIRAAPGEPEPRFGEALALVRLARTPDATRALEAFVARWPYHFAAPRARALLDELEARRVGPKE